MIVKTYLQTGETRYNSAKPSEISKSIRKRPKMYSFSAGRTRRNDLIN